MKKHVFLVTKTYFGCRFWDESLGPELCISQRFRRMILVNKTCIFGLSWGPPDTKTELWCESGDDFKGRVVTILKVTLLNPQDGSKSVNSRSRWSQLPPVLAPDSTHHTHPSTHTLKRFVYLKPPTRLKSSLSTISPGLAEITTRTSQPTIKQQATSR